MANENKDYAISNPIAPWTDEELEQRTSISAADVDVALSDATPALKSLLLAQDHDEVSRLERPEMGRAD